MKRFNKIRVLNFKSLIVDFKKKALPLEDRDIVRRPGNPMLRLSNLEIVVNQ
jgi:hypothetical protein